MNHSGNSKAIIKKEREKERKKEMKALNSLYVFFMFVIFALSINIENCFAASTNILPLSPWQVTIANFQTNGVLSAHCMSKDDDLG